MTIELVRKPNKWHRRLQLIPVPGILEELEIEARQASPLKLPPELIRYFVKRRVRASVKWRQRRCLLGGLLMLYFLSRAGYKVSLHIGCKLSEGTLIGHCWVSSPAVLNQGFMFSTLGTEEVICKELSLTKSG